MGQILKIEEEKVVGKIIDSIEVKKMVVKINLER